MEELKLLIKQKILEKKSDFLTLDKDGAFSKSELDWYANACLEKIINDSIEKVFNY